MAKEVNEKLIPEVNIGTLGHVDHGKSTLVESISGKWPAVHSEELKRGITIRLGYADATIYQCKKCKKLTSFDKCDKCFEKAEPLRTISFVDAPGHETLMATVLAGASLMDGVIFTIAANETCPQPQTREHLMVLDIVGIKNIIIVQTKIDLVSKEKALENYKQIKKFVKETVAENAPIIPVSAQSKLNIEEVLKTIQEVIPTPERDIKKPAKMYVVRSFDVNKPGTEIKKLNGGVVGGGIIQGVIKIGDEIEIKPGIKFKNKWMILKTKVKGLQKAGLNIEEAGPGGLVGVLTDIDPSFTKADYLSGSVAGKELPDVIGDMNLKFSLFEGKQNIKEEELLMINVGTSRTLGEVSNVKKDTADLDLRLPICAAKGDSVVLSRRVEDRWRLIGHGKLV